MISKPHLYYLQKLEELEISRRIKKHIPSNPASLILKNSDRAVWQISLENGQACYMLNNFSCMNHEYYLVHVDALYFYYYWLKASIADTGRHRLINCGLKRTMHLDYKFHHAIDGFKEGVANPVPLAEVTARDEQGTPYLGFINGVTRTFWLLANGALSFPVQVHGASAAQELFNHAGIGNYMRYDDIKLIVGNK